MPTVERVRELLHYEIVTGRFYWLAGKNKGKQAGHSRRDGYLQIRIDGASHYGQRVAHLWIEGVAPSGVVDHSNQMPTCNAWHNLRDIPKVQNHWNMGRTLANTSGYKGVTKHSDKHWRGEVTALGKKHRTKLHLTPEAAFEALRDIRRQVHGEYASN